MDTKTLNFQLSEIFGKPVEVSPTFDYALTPDYSTPLAFSAIDDSSSDVFSVLKQVERILPGPDVLIDPFCGWGTTGVVARLVGLPFIGIELDAERAMASAIRSLASYEDVARPGARWARRAFPIGPSNVKTAALSYARQASMKGTRSEQISEVAAQVARVPEAHPRSKVLQMGVDASAAWTAIDGEWKNAAAGLITSPPFRQTNVIPLALTALELAQTVFARITMVMEWWEADINMSRLQVLWAGLHDKGWLFVSVCCAAEPFRDGLPLLIIQMEWENK